MEQAEPMEQVVAYNQLLKEMDKLYHLAAVQSGLSDTSFWILYSVCERAEAYTQKELCDAWSYSPQTVNSSLKGLKESGFVQLVPSPTSHKNKQIVLTPAGKELIQKIIFPLMEAEKNAFSSLAPDEQALFLTLTKKHLNGLKKEIHQLFHTSSEDCASQCTKL